MKYPSGIRILAFVPTAYKKRRRKSPSLSAEHNEVPRLHAAGLIASQAPQIMLAERRCQKSPLDDDHTSRFCAGANDCPFARKSSHREKEMSFDWSTACR